MRTIIAPTNFSESSLHAVNYAADMASDLSADLLLIHVVDIPTSWDVPVTQYQYDYMLEDAELQLDTLKKQLLVRTDNEIEIHTKAFFSTSPVQLHQLYYEKHPFIIIIGPERPGVLEHFLFGHTFDVTAALPCPVIVVPGKAFYRHIRRIGLATDLKDIAQVPAEAVSAIVELFDASLSIIHVCSGSEEKAAYETNIDAVKKRFEAFNPTFHFEINTSVVKGINAYAKRNKEDLVIMLPKKHSLLASLFHRSQTKTIAHTPAVPVASIHA